MGRVLVRCSTRPGWVTCGRRRWLVVGPRLRRSGASRSARRPRPAAGSRRRRRGSGRIRRFFRRRVRRRAMPPMSESSIASVRNCTRMWVLVTPRARQGPISGASLEHRDQHDVADADRADEQRDRAEAEEQAVQCSFVRGAGDEYVGGPTDGDLAGVLGVGEVGGGGQHLRRRGEGWDIWSARSPASGSRSPPFAEVGVTSRDVTPGRRHPSAMVGAARAAGRLTTDYPAPGVTMPDS